MPAIMDLRNPTLKPRHWQQLEQLIGFKMDELEEPLSLGLLTRLNAFQHTAAIQEISSQASSEASLEALLKKVTYMFVNETGFLSSFEIVLLSLFYEITHSNLYWQPI